MNDPTEPTTQERPWYRFADRELRYRYGWLDKDGVYYGCECYGHQNLMEDLQEAGLLPGGYEEFEGAMVKVTCGGDIITYQKHLTAKQCLTLEALILKYDLVNEAGQFVADKDIRVENGKVKFYRIGERE
jgi:hypothetical protein